MNINVLPTPETATGNVKLAGDIFDKRRYADRWSVAPRSVDNWLAAGLPHLKLSKRMVRIFAPDADRWLREKFGQQRRAA